MIQAGLSWAYFNDKTLVPDPGGSSDINLLRYVSHMMASALRFGTTEHFTPFKEQGVDWDAGHGFVERLGALALREREQVAEVVPSLENDWKIDLKNGRLLHDGRPATSDGLRDYLAGQNAENHGVGYRTAIRALLTARAIGRAGQVYEHGPVQELAVKAARLVSRLAGC